MRHTIGTMLRAWCSPVAGLMLAVATAPAAAGEVHGRVVDTAGAPVRDAVVFVHDLPPGVSVAAPPPAIMDQVGQTFVPHVLPVAVGTAVSFPNRDQIQHHVYSFSRTKTFELPLSKGHAAPPVVFDTPGVVKIGCNIHDWMSGVILVLPTPYFVQTAADGSFTLRDLPAGSGRVAAWHEASTREAAATAQAVDVGETPATVTFTLPLKALPTPKPTPVDWNYE